ncbi:MAG: nuclear transport factor 2 family protein [Vicinamibacterales bacterium]
MSNEQTVRDIYAAFQRQDVPAIVARVTDDVDWRNDGVASRECPWNGNFSGKANLAGFFAAVGEHLDLPVFEVLAMAASGDAVAVHLRVEGTVRKNGRALKNDAVHLWRFNSRGQVSSYRHFNDTAMELAAWRG